MDLMIPGRETDEDELAARVLRAGYLETAPVPDTFSDIFDYTDDDPERTLAERTQHSRAANAARARAMLGRGPSLNWGRKRIVPSRDEWTP
jgi:hypothetical protein